MRTMIEVPKVAKHLAQECAQSLGRVLSDLVRQGLRPRGNPKVRSGVIPILARKPCSQPKTMQAVKDLQESEVRALAV
jgi:hypothetical protein